MVRCRSCLTTEECQYVNMGTSSKDNKNLYDYFNACTQLQATSNDKLPRALCINCVQCLQIAYNFVKVARQADVKLRKLLLTRQQNEVGYIMGELEEPNDDVDIDNIGYEMGIEPELSADPLDIQELNANMKGITESIQKMKDEPYRNNMEDNQKYECDEAKVENDVLTDVESDNYDIKMNDEEFSLHNEKTDDILESKVRSKSTDLELYDRSNKSVIIKEIHAHQKEQPQTEKSTGEESNSLHKEVILFEPTSDSSNDIKCELCKKYIPPQLLKKHEQGHKRRQRTDGEFLCAYCPRVFRNILHLKLHEKRVHMDSFDPVECTICNRRVHPNYLATHIKTIHENVKGERKFACDICGNTFKTKRLLHFHKRLHEERKFGCSVCHKKFIRRCDLNVHLRIHTGERPFACNICDERFPVKGRLTYHLRKHEGLKYTCKECGKEYTNLKNLKEHSYKHTGMPYRCELCKYKCVLRDVFTRHLNRVHNTKMSEYELRAMFQRNIGRMPRISSIDELREVAKCKADKQSDPENSQDAIN